MNATHRKTHVNVYAKPVKASPEWRRIVALGVAIEDCVIEGNDLRVHFKKNGHIAIFHRPHPAKESKIYQVRDATQYLEL